MKSFAAVLLLAAAASAATVVSPSSYVYSAQAAYPEVQVKAVNSPLLSRGAYVAPQVVAPQVVAPVAPLASVYSGQVAYPAQPYAYSAQPIAYSQYVQPAVPGVGPYVQPAVVAPAYV